MNYVRDCSVPYLRAYKKSLIAAIVMLLFAPFFFRVSLLYIVLSVFVVFYLVFSTLRDEGDYALKEIFAVFVLNPLVAMLPTSVHISWLLVLLYTKIGIL